MRNWPQGWLVSWGSKRTGRSCVPAATSEPPLSSPVAVPTHAHDGAGLHRHRRATSRSAATTCGLAADQVSGAEMVPWCSMGAPVGVEHVGPGCPASGGPEGSSEVQPGRIPASSSHVSARRWKDDFTMDASRGERRRPRLHTIAVFVTACHVQMPGPTHPAYVCGSGLLGRGPAVLAMTFSVSSTRASQCGGIGRARRASPARLLLAHEQGPGLVEQRGRGFERR